MQQVYSSGITIAGAYWDGGSHALRTKRATEFIAATSAALDALKQTPTGLRLLTEIDQSGHQVTIYRTKSVDGGNSQAGDSATAGVDMVQDLEARHPTHKTVLGAVIAAATEDLSGRSALQRAFRVGKAKPRFMKRDNLSRLLGVSPRDLQGMMDDKYRIPPTLDAKIRAYLYDFLLPGTGENCRVNFNHLRDNLSDDHKKYLPQSHTWEHRPPAIALGHELIHAWRVMTGMVLYRYGWEEEAMTVGLPPFSGMPLTENRLRIDWGGLAVRPDYRYIGNQTELLRGQKTDRGADQIWQGDDKALHANQGLAMAAAQRRRAMGYDDGGDDDSDWDMDD